DFQDYGLNARLRDERARATTAHDEAGFGEARHGLVDGHAGAAVVRHELVLEWDAVTGARLARENAVLDVGADAAMKAVRLRRARDSGRAPRGEARRTRR